MCPGDPGLNYLPRLSGTKGPSAAEMYHERDQVHCLMRDGLYIVPWESIGKPAQNILAKPWEPPTCVYVVEEPGAVGRVPLRDPVSKDQLLCRRNLHEKDQFRRHGEFHGWLHGWCGPRLSETNLFLSIDKVGSKVWVDQGRSTKLSANHRLRMSSRPKRFWKRRQN